MTVSLLVIREGKDFLRADFCIHEAVLSSNCVTKAPEVSFPPIRTGL